MPKDTNSGIGRSLRPQRLSDYIGHKNIVKTLKLFIDAVKNRGITSEHLMLYGPPGIGKTTLAYIIAREMGGEIKITSGAAITKTGDLAAILTNLKKNDIFFIDEIHRLPKIIEEVLYPAMEDFSLDIVVGKGPSARTLKLDLPRFTLVGATTRLSLLSSPLRDRFGMVHRLTFYTHEDIHRIVTRSSRILHIIIEAEAARLLALRSRQTPRIANRLLKRVRDVGQVDGEDAITQHTVEKALSFLGVDHCGLDDMDRQLLKTIIEKFNGGPVGLNTLAASLSEEEETIQEIYEPFLMQLGFLARTPRGRMATAHAYKHLNIVLPQAGFL